MTDSPWQVYVLRGTRANGKPVYYVGCTNDVTRRLRSHNGELAGGARFTRAYRPWVLAAQYGPYSGRGEAQQIEHAVKKLSGEARTRYR